MVLVLEGGRIITLKTNLICQCGLTAACLHFVLLSLGTGGFREAAADLLTLGLHHPNRFRGRAKNLNPRLTYFFFFRNTVNNTQIAAQTGRTSFWRIFFTFCTERHFGSVRTRILRVETLSVTIGPSRLQ